MTDIEYQTAERPCRSARRVYFPVPDAPVAAAVTPSIFVAVRDPGGRLLLVRRWDSRTWELPDGRGDVGESAVTAAERETRPGPRLNRLQRITGARRRARRYPGPAVVALLPIFYRTLTDRMRWPLGAATTLTLRRSAGTTTARTPSASARSGMTRRGET